MGEKRCTLKPPIPSLFLPFLLLHNQFNLFFAATHTLTAGQCIRDGSNQTLVSHGGIFELGFFSPRQSKKRYIGTWYHGLPTQTIVWVANRANPIADSSGILCLVADGDLALIDGTNATIWSTNISMKSNSVSVMLSDSGNLVLSLQNESYQQFTLWESFDYPSDTYLPGMRAGPDSTTGTNQLFTSWKSEDDPSIGNYSIGIDPRGPPQMFIWEGSTPRWRSGLWNGQSFLGMHYVVTENKMYFSYAPLNSSLEMFVLSPNGIYEQRSRDKNQNGWNSTWHAPGSECENYNKCGDYAICNDEDTIICSCLPGFEPKIPGKWNGGDWSGGCVRSSPLQCDEKEDEFVRVDGVKLPDSSIWIGSIDEKGCEIKCLRNCSCKAYSYANGIGCLVWRDALMDIQQFASGGEGIYVRIVGNASAGKEMKVPSHIIVELTLGLILLILISYVLCKCQDRSAARKKMADTLNLELRIDSPGSASILVALNAKKGKLPDFPLFNLRTLTTATNDFHLSNKLGQGGFGPVYKGKLPSSQEIAVKRLSKSSGQGMEQFKNEVISIAKLRHENLVKLLGCCVEGGEKILVYEYMPNRSLDAFLFDPTKKGILDWKKRFNVIRGIARGLLYVHRDSRLRVVHRDLKASNILLDENMNPKISDFGMAKIFGGDQDEGKTTRVAGTFGYMSPEYAMEGHFSMKSDVYSFGVLLLEIISGERNGTFRNFKNCKNLLEYAWKIWQEDRAMDFMDVCIRRNCAAAEVLKCIQVGLLCVQDNAADRPTMAGVVYMLGREPTSLLIPKKPQFNPTGNLVEMDSSECHLNTKDIPYSTMRER